MEKLDLNSELLKPMKDQLEVDKWVEPRISFQISERVKETKNTIKGSVGNDYELKVDKDTNILYVEKVNEQTSMFDEADEEDEE